jgi:8-oxoguanine DNA glycosylase-like protein
MSETEVRHSFLGEILDFPVRWQPSRLQGEHMSMGGTQSLARLPPALAERQAKIAALSPADQTERFAAANWLAKVPDPAVQALAERAVTELSRRELFSIGEAARSGDPDSQRKLFFATLMWGYADRGGRGPRFARLALDSGRLDETLVAACQAVAALDLPGAWRAFGDRPLPGYREPFFSKYLYFAARTDRNWMNPPLIRDSQVLQTLRFLERYLGADLGHPGRRHVERFRHYSSSSSSARVT